MSRSPNKEEWKKKIKNKKQRKAEFKSLSGVNIDVIYTPDDVSGDYLEKLGFPGEPPFTRGIYPDMYRGRFWTIRQLAGFGGAEDTAKRLKFLIEKGVTGLNITFDYPTLRG
ncbi:MAG: methylmalonyl-CoA mutase, partial [Thermoproteota archaeon]